MESIIFIIKFAIFLAMMAGIVMVGGYIIGSILRFIINTIGKIFFNVSIYDDNNVSNTRIKHYKINKNIRKIDTTNMVDALTGVQLNKYNELYQCKNCSSIYQRDSMIAINNENNGVCVVCNARNSLVRLQ